MNECVNMMSSTWLEIARKLRSGKEEVFTESAIYFCSPDTKVHSVR